MATDPCSLDEDYRVQQTLSPEWLETLLFPPLLKNSPAAPFLSSYFPDGVGLSATCELVKKKPGNYYIIISQLHSRRTQAFPILSCLVLFSESLQAGRAENSEKLIFQCTQGTVGADYLVWY